MNANETTHSVIYGKRLNKSRCLVSLIGDEKHDRFLVGTLSLHSDNEVHLIEYKDEEIACVGVYSHPHEIWNISPCPSRPDLFFTVYHNGKHYESALWKLPVYNDDDDDSSDEDDGKIRKRSNEVAPSTPSLDKNLQEIAVISEPDRKKQLRCVLWEPSGLLDRVLTIDNEVVKEWKIDHLSKVSSDADVAKLDKPTQIYNVKSGQNKIFTGKWDPNHSEKVALGASSKIIEIDLRTNGKATVIENAHDYQVRCLEYNEYRPYYLVSGGDGGRIKFWDMRMTAHGPLRTVSGHSHWVTQVAINPQYDQLVLSASTDSRINLWSIPSVSSKSTAKKLDQEISELEKEAANELQKEDGDHHDNADEIAHEQQPHEEEEPLIDSLISSIDEHEESVYNVAWGNVNHWIFGSVSYDGRVLVHTVPNSEKWRILNMAT